MHLQMVTAGQRFFFCMFQIFSNLKQINTASLLPNCGALIMLISVEGVYRNGKIKLRELPANVNAETRVIVTFVEPQFIDLRARGVGEAQAVDLRVRLATFVEDWNSPEMDIYNNYDAAKANLQAR
jgi:hypothetical protein